MTKMNYDKVRIQRRFERGGREQLERPTNTVGGASSRQPRPRATLRGDECVQKALELVNRYSGNVDWMLAYQAQHEADPQWRPSESDADLIVRVLYDDHDIDPNLAIAGVPRHIKRARPKPAERSRVRTSRPFRASYSGSCCRCSNPFSVGQSIVRVGKGYAHAGCRHTKEQHATQSRRRTGQTLTSKGSWFEHRSPGDAGPRPGHN